MRGMKVQGLAQSQHGTEVLIGDGQVMPGDDTVLQVFGVYSGIRYGQRGNFQTAQQRRDTHHAAQDGPHTHHRSRHLFARH